MSSAAMPGSFLSPIGSVMASLPSGAFPGAHAEVDQVVPVERGQQERGRHAELGEQLVGLPLGVEVRHLVLAHQGGHPVVGERHPLAGVLERGPDDVLDAGGLGRLRHVAGLGDLFLGRKVRPEERDAVGAVGARERLLEARLVIDVGGHDLGAEARELPGLVRVDVPGDGPGGEAAVGIVQDGADQAAALGAGGADYRNDFLGRRHIRISTRAVTGGTAPDAIKTPRDLCCTGAASASDQRHPLDEPSGVVER